MAGPNIKANVALYEKLKEMGLYTKSYDEFVKQFSGREKIALLFAAMKKDGHYTKSEPDFKRQFFSHLEDMEPEKPTKIKIRDNRTDVQDTARFHAEPDIEHIKMVTAAARKYNIDPYTALAVNLAETRFADKTNPFMLGNYDPYSDVVEQSMKYMAEKQNYAKKLGKKNEADIIQAWNGYGTIKGRGSMYGIDTNATPIDMNANPLYGKRVLDLRDRVLKKNPDIINVVEEVMATNPAYEYKLFNP